ncbi:MAG: hypothetical protein ACK5GO_03420 [Ignavibacteria bacterium]|jgi:hypothetical protein
MHTFSSDIEALLTHLDQRGGGLRKRSDIGLLFEHAAEQGAADLINSLVFHGKVIWSTYGLLKKHSEQTDGYANLEREFMQAINDVRILIHDHTASWQEDHRMRFEETYLGMNQGTIRNIVDLAHDFAEIKHLQQDARHSSGNDDAKDNA